MARDLVWRSAREIQIVIVKAVYEQNYVYMWVSLVLFANAKAMPE